MSCITKTRKKCDDDIIFEYDKYLSEYVYEKVFSELSESEKKFVLNMKSDDAVDISSIREKCGFNTKSMSVYRSRLIKKGIIASTSFGYVEFALPRFNEFLKYAN